MKLKKPKTYSGTTVMALIWLLVFLLWAFILSAQCPHIELENSQHTFCWQAPLDTSDAWTPDCPNYSGGGMFWVQFYTDGQPISITVESDIYYTFAGDVIVWCHAILTDGCYGSTLWSTNICSPNLYLINTNAPGADWYADFQLPEGTYYLHLPLGIEDSTEPYLEGCVTVTIFQPSLLGLSVEEYNMLTPYRLSYDVLGRRH